MSLKKIEEMQKSRCAWQNWMSSSL